MKNKELKEKVLEVLEGGLRGSPAARAFSILQIVLIALSILFMVIWNMNGMERWHRVFEITEIVTVGVFTLELILGMWTADARFPGDPHPVLRYLRQPMTIVQILAILPFYLGLALQDTSYEMIAEYFELLKLLHLLKVAGIAKNAREYDKKSGGHGARRG